MWIHLLFRNIFGTKDCFDNFKDDYTQDGIFTVSGEWESVRVSVVIWLTVGHVVVTSPTFTVSGEWESVLVSVVIWLTVGHVVVTSPTFTVSGEWESVLSQAVSASLFNSH